MAKPRCSLCKLPIGEGFTGKVVTGWVTDYSEKYVTEGYPVVLIVCKNCLESQKIEIPLWSSSSYPIRVHVADGKLTIEIVESPCTCREHQKTASSEADRKAQEAQEPAAAASQPAKREEPHAAPPPPPSPPIGTAKGGTTKIPALVCHECDKPITQQEHNTSTYLFEVSLCTGCYLPRSKALIDMMRANEAAGKPITDGVGHTKAVGFCACGAIVNDQMKKVSVMMFNRSMCRRCFDEERAKAVKK